MSANTTPACEPGTETVHHPHRFFRFHLPHAHLSSVFGDDWFALKAEAFARFFGTPTFLVAQTVIGGVAVFLMPRVHVTGVMTLDALLSLLLHLWIAPT